MLCDGNSARPLWNYLVLGSQFHETGASIVCTLYMKTEVKIHHLPKETRLTRTRLSGSKAWFLNFGTIAIWTK